MAKRIWIGWVLFLLAFSLNAQEKQDAVGGRIKPFRNMDLSVSAGVAGLGFDLSSALSRSVTLRAGFQFIPKFKPKMSFGVGLEDGDNPNGEMGPATQDRFDEMTQIFSDFTGCEIDDKIDMIGEPTCYNFTLLVDVAPFKDKRWHFTTGIYAGGSQIAKAYNTTEDMPSLFSVGLYNKMYESAVEDKPLYVYGDKAVYLDPDIADKLIEYGRMSIVVGDKADGSGLYRMEPNSESMVKVRMKVNPVKPYLGFGFGDSFKYKQKETRYSFAFDAGVLFWGGTPEFITHDGTNLSKEVVNIRGKAGDYIRFMKSFKVCPMLSIRFTRRLF